MDGGENMERSRSYEWEVGDMVGYGIWHIFLKGG